MKKLLLALLPLLLALACGKTERLQGRNLYLTHCANCHMEDGSGLAALIPPLAGAREWLAERPDDVVRSIRYGLEGPIMVNGKAYNYPMPGNQDLSEFQIVNLINYVNQAWGNDYGEITVVQAREWLAE